MVSSGSCLCVSLTGAMSHALKSHLWGPGTHLWRLGKLCRVGSPGGEGRLHLALGEGRSRGRAGRAEQAPWRAWCLKGVQQPRPLGQRGHCESGRGQPTSCRGAGTAGGQACPPGERLPTPRRCEPLRGGLRMGCCLSGGRRFGQGRWAPRPRAGSLEERRVLAPRLRPSPGLASVSVLRGDADMAFRQGQESGSLDFLAGPCSQASRARGCSRWGCRRAPCRGAAF